MDEIFKRLLADRFSQFEGLKVDASIPVPELIINEVIETTLRGNKKINECRVSIRANNKVSVHLKTPLWFLPINLNLELERSVDITAHPQIRARLENLVLVGKLGSFFKVLPEGLSLQDDYIVIDPEFYIPNLGIQHIS